MPLFSIVIPVRDRAHMLHYALQSVLNQNFEDYEIVVSDNCSSDNTADIVKEFSDSRVRYFRSHKRLPMHENYEFVFSKARGEWIICLTSRFVMWRKALERIAEVIVKYRTQVINWEFGLYYTDNWFEPKRRNKMVLFHPYTNKATECNSDDALHKLFNLSYHDFDIPMPGYSAYHRDILKKVKQDIGSIFFLPAPDRTSCVGVLSATPKYCHINMPLMLAGICKESHGASSAFRQGEEALKFREEYRGYQLIKHAPLNIDISVNHSVESFLKMKAIIPDRLSHLQLNLVRYFIDCFLEIMKLKRRGVDVAHEKDEFFSKLRHQPAHIRRHVLMKIIYKPVFSWFRQKLSPFIDDSKMLRHLSSLVAKRQVICGDVAGFSNILEAENYLDSILD